MKTKCLICGKEYEHEKGKNGTRYCSPECKKESERRRVREYVRKNLEEHRERSKILWKKYRARYKKRQSKFNKKYREAHPEVENCRYQVRKALWQGILVKLPCEICGEKEVFAHHDDYSKPLEVIWLCKKHHEQLHSKIKEGKNENNFIPKSL